MGTAKKELKEGFNRVTVVGTLVEKNLEDSFYMKQDGTRVDQLKGSISVRTDDHEVHEIRLKTNKFTNAGAENTFYKGYKTVQDEFVSVADKDKNPELVVSEVSVSGKLTTNEYYGHDGKLRQYQQIEGVFVNRLTEKDDPTPRAVFETEIYISKTRPEMDADGETGRAIVESYIPTFHAIIPYNFTTVVEGADFFIGDIQKGQTIKVYGQILNKKEEHVKMVEAAFGAPIEEKSYTYTTESLIQNAKQPYEEDSVKAFDPEQVNDRLVKREVYLEGQKTRNQQQGQQGGQPSSTGMNAFGTGANTGGFAFGASQPKTGVETPPVDVSNLF